MNIDEYFGKTEEVEIRKHEKLTPRDRAKLYRTKKLKENPNWDKIRMKKWRTEHKDSYHYGQARFHFRKLTAEQKTRLLDESKMPSL
jgi:catalase